jgi:hypothetical protein
MKTLLLALLALTISAPVFAAETGLSADDAQAIVVRHAHAYIAAEAPDFGGEVHSPCDTSLNGDVLQVVCKGIANETVGGDGSVKISIECVGQFVQGQDGNFSLDGKVLCRQK